MARIGAPGAQVFGAQISGAAGRAAPAEACIVPKRTRIDTV
jgi:hypothetical protein